MGNRWGFRSGVGHMKDCKIGGDLYVQDDIVFSDVSAGVLGVTGGIDMQSTTSAIGIDLGGTFSTSAINIDGTVGAAIDITVSDATTSPSRLCYWQYTSTGNMSAGGMTGLEIRSTFNGSATTTNSITGAEIKARHTTGNAYTAGQLRGVVGNADTKNGTTTTAYGVEGSIDVSAGGTITTSACFHGNLNNSGTVTNSYGLFVEGVSGYNLTKGIFMQYITTGIDIAACTTGISIGTATTGISIAGTISGSAIEIGVNGGTALTLTNASHALEINTSHSAITGTVRSAEIIQAQLVADASIINEVLYVNFDSSVSTGDWVNAIVGRINFTAPGNANGGMAAAICSEMSLMAAAQSGGAYYSLDVEMDCPASFTCAANAALPVAFQKFGVWGDATAITSFETGGYLFHIDGLASPSSSALIFHTTGTVSATHGLRINIDGTDYDILLKASTYA